MKIPSLTYHCTFPIHLDQRWGDDCPFQQNHPFVCYFPPKPETKSQQWDVHFGELNPRIGDRIKVAIKVFKDRPKQSAKLHRDALRFLETLIDELKLGSLLRIVPTCIGRVDSVSYLPLTSDRKKSVKKEDLVLIQKLPSEGHIEQLVGSVGTPSHRSRSQQNHPVLAILVGASASTSGGRKTISSLEGVLVGGVYHLTSATLCSSIPQRVADSNVSLTPGTIPLQQRLSGGQDVPDDCDCRIHQPLVPSAPELEYPELENQRGNESRSVRTTPPFQSSVSHQNTVLGAPSAPPLEGDNNNSTTCSYASRLNACTSDIRTDFVSSQDDNAASHHTRCSCHGSHVIFARGCLRTLESPPASEECEEVLDPPPAYQFYDPYPLPSFASN